MIQVSKSQWGIEQIHKIIQGDTIEILPEVQEAINKNREYLNNKVKAKNNVIYGINTGFGSLCDIKIPQEKIHQLQLNLVRSHACGTGPEVPEDIIRIIQALKIKNLSLACSGIRYDLLQHMANVYNAGIRPEMFQQGSLGASGDLAPLSHLAICLIGEGKAYSDGKKVDAFWALTQKNINPISLEGKEGLALLNGTQFSTAYLAHACYHGNKLYRLANLITALSYEAYDCGKDPLDHRIHKIRNQKGQIESAEAILKHLEGGRLVGNNPNYVQDPYAFRCTPQVHGATKDTLDHVHKIMEREINAVTDNPLVFSDTDAVLSGGNFHAQPIALACDFLAIAMAELGSISERRIFNLVDGKRDLPSFLVENQGINSGFMIAQYTAAAIVSENKQLCTPASIDSITSSKGQEDHVSMAANAGRKLYTVVDNLYQILAIELLTACQALEFRNKNEIAPELKKVYETIRTFTTFVREDIILGAEMRKVKTWLKESGDKLL